MQSHFFCVSLMIKTRRILFKSLSMILHLLILLRTNLLSKIFSQNASLIGFSDFFKLLGSDFHLNCLLVVIKVLLILIGILVQLLLLSYHSLSHGLLEMTLITDSSQRVFFMTVYRLLGKELRGLVQLDIVSEAILLSGK